LFAEAAQMHPDCIECPQCRKLTLLKDTARYGTADRQALIQRTLENKRAAKQLSVDYFLWCSQPSTKLQVFFEIKCEAIKQMMALVLTQEMNLEESCNMLYRVDRSLKQWFYEFAQKQSEETQLFDYMSKVHAHVQAIQFDVRMNVKNSDDLQNWRRAKMDIQKIPPGYERFCVPPEDMERFGVILRAKFPAHFRRTRKRDHANMS